MTTKNGSGDLMIIRLKNVHRVEAKGKVYFYHRPTKTKIKAEYGTQAFIDEVNALNGRPNRKTTTKTLGKLLTAFRASEHFKALAAVTRSDYIKAHDRVKGIEEKPLDTFTTGFLVKVRDRLTCGRRKKNYTIDAISSAFSWGVERDWLPMNPAKAVKAIKRPKNAPVANRPWKAHEIAAVFEVLPRQIQLAAAIALYTGMREGNVIALPWSAYDGQTISYKPSKDGNHVVVPVHPDLKAVLDTQPKRSPVIVVGEKGKPYGEDGFRTMFFRPIRGLVKAGKVEKGLTFHGLRHTMGTWLADAGNDRSVIKAVLGHKTDAMAEHYARHADRTKKASQGIASLERNRKARCKTAVKPAGGRGKKAS